MIYTLEQNGIKEIDFNGIENNSLARYLCVLDFSEAKDIANKFDVDEKFFVNTENNMETKFENHDGFDFICLNSMNYKDMLSTSNTYCIYINKNVLIFVCKDTEVINKTIIDITYNLTKRLDFEKLLHVFFDRLISNDTKHLESIENEISDIEDKLLSTQSGNFVKDIIYIRKKLLYSRRYYEQILSIFDNLLENENDIINNEYIRYFKISEQKVNRLYNSVLHLKDYLTQVREAYQAQADITLNSIMKLFTVISVVFMPLTLIVGWYGMNFDMPEYAWNYGYLFVVILSIIVFLVCIFYIKKNKWF